MNQLNNIEQLVDIYYKEEWWHTTRMTPEKALHYHKLRYENGSIHTYEDEQGNVLGYYERYFEGDKCILYNVWVSRNHRQGKVFKELYRHFFSTMPKNITRIIGEKQRLGGKLVTAIIRKGK